MTLTLQHSPDTHTLLQLTDDDWSNTPEAVCRVVERLWEENQRLREQLGQTSRNSHRSPSTDPPTVPKREKMPTGGQAGGQAGHADTNRPLVPEDRVTEIVSLRPACCRRCGAALSAVADTVPRRHQLWDLPPITATVTEYRLHTLVCPRCGTATAAELPTGVPTGAYSPRVAAVAATFTGQYHLSKRAAAEVLDTLCGLPISAGSISTLEATMSAALATPVAEVREAVRAAERKWVDETGWAQQREPDPADPAPPGKLARAWLWVVVTATVTLFCIRRSRGAKVARELLGDNPQGIIHSDRHSAYRWLEPPRRQLCWAHLQRDFQQLVDRGGVAARIGEALLAETRKMFARWHRIRDGTLARADFVAQMAPVQARVRTLLQEGATTVVGEPGRTADARTVTFCRILQRLDPALWSFVTTEGVEPTNNRAERAIRPAVLWRKMSFGTQTSAGSRFVERVMTATATCRQQQKNILTYLTAVAEAAYHRQPAPSLLYPPTGTL